MYRYPCRPLTSMFKSSPILLHVYASLPLSGTFGHPYTALNPTSILPAGRPPTCATNYPSGHSPSAGVRERATLELAFFLSRRRSLFSFLFVSGRTFLPLFVGLRVRWSRDRDSQHLMKPLQHPIAPRRSRAAVPLAETADARVDAAVIAVAVVEPCQTVPALGCSRSHKPTRDSG